MIERRTLAAAAAAALAAAAPPPHARSPHEAAIEGMEFAPRVLRVRRGEVVTWNNRDLVPHTVTAAGHFDSGVIRAGASWSHRAAAPGSYEYVCSLHPAMKATLVVE